MRRIALLGMSAVELLRAAAARARELDQAATPGPWQHVDYSDPPGQPLTAHGIASTFRGCGSVITMGEDVAGGEICAPNGDLYPRGGYSPLEDMAFIAAFRAVAAPLADLLAACADPVEDNGANIDALDELLAAVALALLPGRAGVTS